MKRYNRIAPRKKKNHAGSDSTIPAIPNTVVVVSGMRFTVLKTCSESVALQLKRKGGQTRYEFRQLGGGYDEAARLRRNMRGRRVTKTRGNRGGVLPRRDIYGYSELLIGFMWGLSAETACSTPVDTGFISGNCKISSPFLAVTEGPVNTMSTFPERGRSAG